MAAYVVIEVDGPKVIAALRIEAANQQAAALSFWEQEGSTGDLWVYTLAKGSPISTFRQKVETVTTVERLNT